MDKQQALDWLVNNIKKWPKAKNRREVDCDEDVGFEVGFEFVCVGSKGDVVFLRSIETKPRWPPRDFEYVPHIAITKAEWLQAKSKKG